MAIRLINPPQMFNSVEIGFSQASLDSETGLITIAAQFALDRDRQVLGGDDIVAQAHYALANMKRVLDESHSSIADLIGLRTYIVDHSPEKLHVVVGELLAWYGDVSPVPNSIIGVQSLAFPTFLIGFEATARVKT
jgi:enamine deaminase RidA (YjgF/YER057c/UK114 family)